MTSVGGFARPMSAAEDAALSVEFDANGTRSVYAALAPGRFERIGISGLRVVGFNDAIRWTGPACSPSMANGSARCGPARRPRCVPPADGPWVVDVAKVLGFAVCRRGLVNS